MGSKKQQALLGQYVEMIDLAVGLEKSGDHDSADVALREATKTLEAWEWEERRQANIKRWPLKHERYFKQ